MNRVFLIAGRTGGPFFPLPAVVRNLKNIEPICIGVRGGFEDQAAKTKGWQIHYLPDTRLTIFSFKREKLRETIKNYLELIKNIFLLVWSFLKSLYLLLKLRPKMIYSTGSFLAVPMILAAKVTNTIHFTNTKIVIHQQDPLPGLSNRITIDFADLATCVFDYTKSNYPKFAQVLQIPNPIDTTIYHDLSLEENITNPVLKQFLTTKSDLPLLLIFGGGSGSEDINVWTLKNIDGLLQKFRIVHLIGILQKKDLMEVDDKNYLRLEALFEEMPAVMDFADVVLCRAGMASITELLYLQKPAYLVPLPSTHQEQNAEMVKNQFYILDQKDRPLWLDTISKTFPQYFEHLIYPDRQKTESQLADYYQKLQSLLDN
jgi:UDP-N-acetylglucosamine--N-acetylmuramyl-(pentapeptide) pyrophosphoryl-undecaprenol N-acetylglucosamine transferase